MRRGLLTIAVILLGGAPPAQGEPRYRSYTVEPGDSCWSIALKLYGNGQRYQLIHQHNQLGPLPHLLKPGQQLRLPAAGVQPDATIRWVRRDVRAKAPQTPDWRRAREEMGLWKLYKVATGGASAAGIIFEDRSELQMREEALLVIYGRAAALAQSTRRVKTAVVVEEGVVKGGLEQLDRAASLTVRTPSSTVDLRSRSTQIEVDRERSSIVSVHDGEADVSARGARVTVPKDHGTLVKKGGRPSAPRPLPAAPGWADAADEVVIVPAGTTGQIEARWTATSQAARYRLELARDRAFRFPLVDAVVGGGILRFRARDLSPGSYFARVAAIDGNRLESQPSPVKQVELLAARASRQLRPDAQGIFEAVGLLRIDLPGPAASEVEVSLDDGSWQVAPALRLSRPGLHIIRARRRGASSWTELRVRLLAVRGELQVAPPADPARPRAVALRVTDERGRPASVPGLELIARPGGPVKLRAERAGLFGGELPLAAAASTVHLRAGWSGGELARTDLPATPRPAAIAAPAPAPTEVHVSPAAATALEWGYPALGFPSRAARPTTFLGLSSFVSGPAAGGAESADQAVYLRLALRGGLSLLRGRLGLDADLPWFDADVAGDGAGQSELGDLRLGGRWVALERGAWTLAPSLRLTLPTGGYPREQRRALVEPALIAEWRHLDRVTASAGLSLPVQAGPDGGGVYQVTTAGAGVRVFRDLCLSAELALQLRLRGADGLGRTTGLAAGGAVSWQLSRARLGVAAGAGLGDGGRQLFGRFSAGLFVELGFAAP